MRNKLTQIMALALAFVLFASSQVFAEEISKEQLEEIMPQYLSTNNAGTKFFMTFHPCWETGGANNAMKIYVSSGVSTTVTATIPAFGYKKTEVAIPNSIVEFSFPPSTGAMYRKTDRQAPEPEQIWRQRAIIIEADDPIICYGVTRYQYTSDGYLGIPVSGLGQRYQASSFADPGRDPATGGVQYLGSYISVVAAYDQTDVSVVFGGTTETWVPSKAAGSYEIIDGQTGFNIGDRVTRRLNEGDVWLIPSRGDNSDMSGTLVNSSKPVAVISGSFCAYIPVGTAACDYIIEQELPMNTWGKKYHVTPIKGRRFTSWVKMYFAENFTSWFANGEPMGTMIEVGYEDQKGFISRRLRDDETPNQAVTISADKPFSITQYNPGQNDDGVESDPFQMILTPIEQYQNEVIFNTPGIRGGASFKDNFINVVYLANADGSIPEDIELGQAFPNNPEFVWTKLSNLSGGAGEFLPDPEQQEEIGRLYAVKQVELPDPTAVYKIRSVSPIAAYGYGFDSYDSYGYPLSVALADLSVPDTLPPRVDYTMDCLGNITGRITDEPEFDAENRSNLRYIELDSRSVNYDWVGGETPEFVPGTDHVVEFELKILDPTVPAEAVLYMVDRRGNQHVEVIKFFPTDISIIKSREEWGLLASHEEPVTKQFTLVNNRDSEITFDAIEIELQSVFDDEEGDVLDYQGFTISNLPEIESPIAPNAEITFDVTFDPGSVGEGTFRDSIGVKMIVDGELCYYRYLSRVGAQIGSPAITVTDVEFPRTTVNTTSQAKNVTVSNPGSTDLIITGYTGPALTRVDNGDPIYEERINGLDNGDWVIPSGGTAQYSVTFTPEDVQVYEDEIVFESNADPMHPDHDPVGKLLGEGQRPGLEVNGYDWERRRVNLAKYETYQYRDTELYEAANDAITLRNPETQDTRISEVTVDEDLNGDAFKVELNGQWESLNDPIVLQSLFEGQLISAGGGSLTYPVVFDPRVEGEHRLVLTFTSDAGNAPQSMLEGVGIYPQVQITDINFTEDGPHIAQDAPVTANFTVECLDWGPYSDAVEIQDFVVQGAGNEISEDGVSYGTQAMMWDEAGQATYPLTLQPGDRATFTAEFAPQVAGEFQAQLATLSDASEDVISTWDGEAVNQAWDVTDQSYETCVSDPEVKTFEISNDGSDDLDIVSLRLTNADGSDYTGGAFSITQLDGNAVQLPFTLGQGLTVEVSVEYLPTQAGNDEVLVEVTTDDLNGQPKTSSLTGIAHYYPRTTSSEVDRTTVDLTTGADQNINYTIYINESNEEMTYVTNPTTLEVTVTYSTEFLGIQNTDGGAEENIRLGGAQPLNGYVVTDVVRSLDRENLEETITLKIEGTEPIISSGRMEILRITFFGYLLDPNGNIDDLRAEITHTVTDSEPCVDYEPTKTSEVRFAEICVKDLRLVSLNPENFSLKQISPNPVGSSGANIEFSVGLPNVHTELNIYNTAGEKVAVVLNEMMASGSYSVPLPDLSSGIYFYEMKSGPFTETKKVVVRK
jgi:hypothetical protein